jgi:hypothetical protein
MRRARLRDSILRRDALLDRVPKGAATVRVRHPRRRLGETESELERVLRDLRVHDYKTVVTSFDPRAVVKEFIVSEDVSLLRLFGQRSQPIGRFFFCCPEPARTAPSGLLRPPAPSWWADSRGLALPPGNTAEGLAVATLRRGTLVFAGVVADNFMNELGVAKRGGGTQFFVPFPGKLPVETYDHVAEGIRPSDVALVTADGDVARYRLSPQRLER